MTFSDILADVYRNLGEPSSPATATVTRLKAYVNEGMLIILSDPVLMTQLTRQVQDSTATVTITSVASQVRYVTRNAVGHIISIADRTNDFTLKPMSLQEYRLVNPDPTAYTGTPTHYVVLGQVALETLPSNASQIFVKSDSASDNTQTCVLEAIRTGGVRVPLSVSMNGVTAASLNSAITDVVDAHDFYLSAATVGTVTLHEDSGSGTELARIPIGATRPRYTGVYFWPTPAAANTYAVDFRHLAIELVQDGDEPLFPVDFHYLLSVYAQMKHFGTKSDDTRAERLEQVWRRGLSNLRYFVSTRTYDIPVAGRRNRVGYSRLGGYYPADYYF